MSLPIIGGMAVFLLCLWLRNLPIGSHPLLLGELQFTCGLLAVTFAGTAFVRFQGTRDRLPLILAASFLMVGVTLASSSLGLVHLSPAESNATLRDPLTWVIGRTLLGVLLMAALLVEKRYAWSRYPVSDVASALVVVILLTTLLSASHRYLPSEFVVFPGSWIARPGNLIPAAFFLVAAELFRRRLKNASAPFDHSLYFASAINCWCSIAAAESAQRLDAAFALAAVLQFCSYAVLLGGTLLDITFLFQEIRRLAVSDSLTGLANYRHLIDSLENEIQRTGRTGRAFAILLLDLDGLKKINDQFGHLAGTRALSRVAKVLRSQSRAIDTAARQGGDEFALILPETTERGAQEVLERVRNLAANDGEQPPISLSAGFALYPRDANTAEKLMEAADRALYEMKEQHKINPQLVKQAAR